MNSKTVISSRVKDLDLGLHLQDAAHRTILDAFQDHEVDTFVGPYVLFARRKQTAWLLDTLEGFALPLMHPDFYLDLNDHMVEADGKVTIHWTHRYKVGPDQTFSVQDAEGNEEIVDGYQMDASLYPQTV